MILLEYREERDSLGKLSVPKSAYYGIATQRAISNFPISGMRMQSELIRAYAMIKRAAAIANMNAGSLERKKAEAIVHACDELLAGKYESEFQVDIFQAGAGTSINMNLNEVIANRAIELLGGKKGQYDMVHPNDHVNMSQSTNDTMPSAINIAVYIAAGSKLMPELMSLSGALRKKASEFSKVAKIGRTHLQDAVPMTLGEEFSGYAASVSRAVSQLEHASDSLRELPLGGTAVGNGVNASVEYARQAISEINKQTGLRFKQSANRFESMQNMLPALSMSHAFRELAIVLNRIANDLRLLSSGPRAGFNDITLPAVQPGSSIMPGKVNPSMAEMLNMVCMQVLGSCSAVESAADAGQLELNVFMPVIAYNLLFSVSVLASGVHAFTAKCVRGIKANEAQLKSRIEMNLALATLLAPTIGYAKAAEVAKRAFETGKSVREACMDMKLLDKKALDRIFS